MPTKRKMTQANEDQNQIEMDDKNKIELSKVETPVEPLIEEANEPFFDVFFAVWEKEDTAETIFVKMRDKLRSMIEEVKNALEREDATFLDNCPERLIATYRAIYESKSFEDSSWAGCIAEDLVVEVKVIYQVLIEAVRKNGMKDFKKDVENDFNEKLVQYYESLTKELKIALENHDSAKVAQLKSSSPTIFQDVMKENVRDLKEGKLNNNLNLIAELFRNHDFLQAFKSEVQFPLDFRHMPEKVITSIFADPDLVNAIASNVRFNIHVFDQISNRTLASDCFLTPFAAKLLLENEVTRQKIASVVRDEESLSIGDNFSLLLLSSEVMQAFINRKAILSLVSHIPGDLALNDILSKPSILEKIISEVRSTPVKNLMHQGLSRLIKHPDIASAVSNRFHDIINDAYFYYPETLYLLNSKIILDKIASDATLYSRYINMAAYSEDAFKGMLLLSEYPHVRQYIVGNINSLFDKGLGNENYIFFLFSLQTRRENHDAVKRIPQLSNYLKKYNKTVKQDEINLKTCFSAMRTTQFVGDITRLVGHYVLPSYYNHSTREAKIPASEQVVRQTELAAKRYPLRNRMRKE